MPVNTNFPPLTVENYKLLPETGPRYQLIQGDLYMAPAPNRFHQEISRNLQFELHSYLKRNPIGRLFDAPFDVYLDQINVFQPDSDLREMRGSVWHDPEFVASLLPTQKQERESRIATRNLVYLLETAKLVQTLTL